MQKIEFYTSIHDLRDFIENGTQSEKLIKNHIIYSGEILGRNYSETINNISFLYSAISSVKNFHILMSNKTLDMFSYLSPLTESQDSNITMADCAEVDEIKSYIKYTLSEIIKIDEEDIPDQLLISEFSKLYYMCEFFKVFENNYPETSFFRDLRNNMQLGYTFSDEMYFQLNLAITEMIEESEITDKTVLIYYFLIKIYSKLISFIEDNMLIFFTSEISVKIDGNFYSNILKNKSNDFFENINNLFNQNKNFYTTPREKFNLNNYTDYDKPFRRRCYQNVIDLIE